MLRKNLKNHVARFFFEFLVVVSGVLVAYTINNASQVAKDRKAEKVLLSSINDDLRADSVSLRNMVEFNNEKIKWIHGVIQKIRDEHVSADSVATYSSSLGSFNFFKSQRFNYLAMLEGGKISLIESQEIRKQIIRYYDAVENLDKVSDKLIDIMLTNYYPTLLQHYDRVDDVVINPTFFKSPEFKNYFGFVFNEIRSQQFHAEIIQKEGIVLRRLIEEYLAVN